jgi:predicted nucleotidyltransferase
MGYAGIVAEFNPLHRGHVHCIEEALRLSGAEGVVVALSSSFVQRGTPALLDLRTRAQTALRAGANLVIGIPTPFSCANAGVFAGGSVDLLAATGLVTDLVFGEETPGPEAEAIPRILVQEPASFKQALRERLKEGFSFVEARSDALETLLPGARAFLRRPNNSLSVAYRCRILERNLPIRPISVRRIGLGYHDSLSPSPTPEETRPVASATAIRALLDSGDRGEALALLPEASRPLVEEALREGRALVGGLAYGRLVRSLLLRSTLEELEGGAEMKEGLHRRIHEMARRTDTLEELVEACVSRRYPRGRILRHLAHWTLGIDFWTHRACQRLGPPYIRVLGADGRGRQALRDSRGTRTLPLFSRVGTLPSAYARRVAEIDFRASAIWETLVPGGSLRRARYFEPLLLP